MAAGSLVIDIEVQKIKSDDVHMIQLSKKLEEVYKMTSDPRGRAFIIDNMDFSPARGKKKDISDRHGSNIDGIRLHKLLKGFHFEVTILTDKTAKEIQEICKTEQQNVKHRNNDAFIMFIMSHGSPGAICGTDGEFVKIKDITAYFDGKNCPNLRHKPKLFFISACQGGNSAAATTDAVPMSQGDSEEAIRRSRHPKADIFVAYSTVEDEVSYRDVYRGTWFIQLLVTVFAGDGHRMNIDSMMKKVIREVSSKTTDKNSTMVPEIRHSLTKELYFFPGIAVKLKHGPFTQVKDDGSNSIGDAAFDEDENLTVVSGTQQLDIYKPVAADEWTIIPTVARDEGKIIPTVARDEWTIIPTVARDEGKIITTLILKQGTLTEVKDSGSDGIYDAAFDEDDNLAVVSWTQQLNIYSPDMTHTTTATLDHTLVRITACHGNRFIITSATKDKLLVTSHTGAHLGDITVSGLERTRGISVNTASELVVCEWNGHRVSHVDISSLPTTKRSYKFKAPCRRVSSTPSGMFNMPQYNSCSNNGHIVVSDWLTSTVTVFTRDSNLVFKYGDQGQSDGELHYPQGVCTDRHNNVVIADYGNHRVVLLSPQGKFIKYILTQDDGLQLPRCVAINSVGQLFVGCDDCKYFLVKYVE